MGNNSSGHDTSLQTDFVKSEVKSNCVVIFSKQSCSYCTASKQVFNSLGVQAKVIELDQRDDMTAIQDALQRLTGARTVPRVFINGKCIGGNSETQKLKESGELQLLVQQCSM